MTAMISGNALPPPPLAADVRVGVGHHRSEVAIGFLLADPFEERLELRGGAEQVDAVVEPGQLGVGPGGVQLLVAGLAERRAVFRLAALLFGR